VTQDLFSIDEVAERLQLHVKTVRKFVRDGRLKATRVGKQYRISRADLEAFTGSPASPSNRATVRTQRHVEASSIVQIDAISRDDANRVTNSLIAASNVHRDGDQPLRIDSIYDEERGRLKVIVTGSVPTCAELFRFIDVLLTP
jgi:excisionase family DNA binding protein